MSLPSPMNELVDMHNHGTSVILAVLTTLLIIGVCGGLVVGGLVWLIRLF